jgi:hypothetical protein
MDTVGGIYRADPAAHVVDDNDAVRFVTDASGRQYVVPVGGVADSAAVGTTAPSLIGGKYSAAPAARHDGDAVMLQTTITGMLLTSDSGQATDDAAAPAVGPLVMGKFGASSPDANDAAPLRCDATGCALVSDVNTATDDAAAPTVGPLVMGKFGASSPDANDAAPLQCNATGILMVAQPTSGAFVADAGPYTYGHLAASGQIKGAPGFLHAVAFNTPAAASVCTIYDNVGAAGNVIGIVTLAAGSTAPFSMPYDVTCTSGIYINMSAPVDVTASYR